MKPRLSLLLLCLACCWWGYGCKKHNHTGQASRRAAARQASSRPAARAHPHARHTKHKATEHKGHKHHQHKGHQGHKHHNHPKVRAAKPKFDDRSIYQVASTWRNREGKQVAITSLRGKVRVIAMVYTHCQSACPIIVSDLKHIAARLPKAWHKKLGFVLVSIDPARDTPKRLKTFGTQSKLDPKGWTLLHGKSDQILELAALLGVKYKRISSADFAHSNLITVLDQQGVIRHRQIGLAQKPDASVSVIKKLLSAP